MVVIVGISHERCQWLALRVWWQTLAFVTHKITWQWAYVAWLSLLLWKNWYHFLPKSTQSCYNCISRILIQCGIVLFNKKIHIEKCFTKVYVIYSYYCLLRASILSSKLMAQMGYTWFESDGATPRVHSWWIACISHWGWVMHICIRKLGHHWFR